MPADFNLTPLEEAANRMVVMSSAQRRWSGLILGAMLGLAYGVISQFINTWVQPGLHYYQPPLGVAGNILLFCLMGAALGLVCAWAQSSANGVIIGGAVMAVVVLLAAHLTGKQLAEGLSGKILITFFLFFPFAGGCVPIAWLFRWAVNEQGEEIERFILHPRRAWAPLLIVVMCAALGLLSLYRPEARQLLLQTDQMMRSALQAGSPDDLPAPLRPKDVMNFRQQAGSGEYSLQWVKEGLNIYAIPAVATADYEKSAVITRFASGWTVVCLYPRADYAPECRGYAQLTETPYLPQTGN